MDCSTIGYVGDLAVVKYHYPSCRVTYPVRLEPASRRVFVLDHVLVDDWFAWSTQSEVSQFTLHRHTMWTQRGKLCLMDIVGASVGTQHIFITTPHNTQCLHNTQCFHDQHTTPHTQTLTHPSRSQQNQLHTGKHSPKTCPTTPITDQAQKITYPSAHALTFTRFFYVQAGLRSSLCSFSLCVLRTLRKPEWTTLT